MATVSIHRSMVWALLSLATLQTVLAQSGPIFVDVADEVGLSYLGPVYAAAATDFDRDGWIDLAVSNHGELRLFRNLQGKSFVESDDRQVMRAGDTHGVSWVDLDGDGWLDLYLSIGAARGFGKGPNRFYRNLGGRSLQWSQPVAEELADPLGRGRCSVPWDMDGDGSLELLILNSFDDTRPHRLIRRSENGWQDVAQQYGLQKVRAECMTILYLESEPTFVAYGSGEDSGHLFRLGDTGELHDVTETLGLKPQGTIYGVAAGDYDNDGDTDLYLVRGHGIPAMVSVAEGQLAFRILGDDPQNRPVVRFATQGRLELDFDLAGRHDPDRIRYGAQALRPETLPWQIAADDPRLEGRPDLDTQDETSLLFWRNPAGELTIELVRTDARFRAASGRIHSTQTITLVSAPSNTPGPQPNKLLENREGRLFDVTGATGTGDKRSGRDAVFFDMDNDGDLDLFVVNGGTAFFNQPDVLYQNNGNRRFAEIARLAGVVGSEIGRGSTGLALDFDNDGDLDLFTTNGDGPPLGNRGSYALWRNDRRSAPSAQIHLIGRGGNAAALGARVVLETGDRRLELQRVATTSRFSTSVLPFHFGLDGATEAEIEILWPDGHHQSVVISAGDRKNILQTATSYEK